jgi:hypothetical protein
MWRNEGSLSVQCVVRGSMDSKHFRTTGIHGERQVFLGFQRWSFLLCLLRILKILGTL